MVQGTDFVGEWEEVRKLVLESQLLLKIVTFLLPLVIVNTKLTILWGT